VDYRGILDRQQFPAHIDYLQIDLDVDNRSTLDTLELLNATVFDKYTFATVTFEHDYYTGDHHNTRAASRQIFASRGYVLAFPDVRVLWEGSHKPFEDWYVHPDLVDMNLVKDVLSSDSLTSDEIKKKLDAPYTKFHGYNLLDNELRSYFPDMSYKGIILEVGAFQPILLSNTYHFERNGWDTYQIEANPHDIPMFNCRKNRCLNYAISDYDKDNVDFTVVSSNEWTAGFSSLSPSIPGHDQFTSHKIKVTMRKMNTLLENELSHLKNKKIDIMTIDVEGHEENVLKGMDLQTVRPYLLCVEDHRFNNGTSELHKYILSQNYRLDKHNGLDSFYLAN
jgi:FkbM family methyltransferase